MRIGHDHAFDRVVDDGGGQLLAHFAAVQSRTHRLDLVEVLHHAHKVGGLVIHFRQQRHRAQHGYFAPAIEPQAMAFGDVMVDLAGQQALQLARGPVTVGGIHHVAKIDCAHLRQRAAQGVAHALVGPQEGSIRRHTRNARRHMAGDLRQLLRHRRAPALGAAHALEQPPGHGAGQQHVTPALPGLKTGQLLRVGDKVGQQNIARKHPDDTYDKVQQHAPPWNGFRGVARIAH